MYIQIFEEGTDERKLININIKGDYSTEEQFLYSIFD